MRYLLFLFFYLAIFSSCKKDDPNPGETEKLSVSYIYIGETAITSAVDTKDIALDRLIEVRFDRPVNRISAEKNIILLDAENQELELSFSFFNENKLVKIDHQVFDESTSYKLILSGDLIGENKETFDEQTFTFTTYTPPLILESIQIDEKEINPVLRIKDISREPTIDFHFNIPIALNDLYDYSSFSVDGTAVGYTLSQVDGNTISLSANQVLEGYQKYQFNISSGIENRIGRPFNGLDLNFYTELDSTVKFPEITDNELLTLVQQQTFKYFWDFGHPVSGLVRDRNTSGDVVTISGTGFGIMSIIVGIERNFITRAQGIGRLETIINFLEGADRFHGAWPHWLNGSTGKVIPFSTKDDGGDLVETAFLVEGLLTLRQYLNSGNTQENDLINKINILWQSVEWDWYTQDGQNVLYWHWSPNYAWELNHQIRGYNEAFNTYILAKVSPDYSIANEVYTQGWANSGAIANGNQYYNYTLPLGEAYGGPLFYEHYSFVALDPRNLNDTYANYWNQAVNHTLINWAYCNDNPKKYVGYSADCWGLTASDNHEGYNAHSPTNDLGVITPTAAISSIPYTPEQSINAIKHFYYLLGDKLWGEYGFYDAFNVTENWWADSYLAIDQGPIILMIENYRTGLLWDLFMSAPEVQNGLTKLGFTY